MKNGILIAAFITVLSTNAQAKIDICVFDLLGKAGESYKMVEEWALAAKSWNADLNLMPYQDEAKAQSDFEAGKCDGVSMTSMRARKYNKFAGSIDALGAITSNSIAKKAISYVLDPRNKNRMVSRINGDEFEVAAIAQIGLAYVFVRDKNIDTIEKGKGKKFAYLHYDQAQKMIVERLDLVGVPSEISDFAKKFINKQVDVIAAPAYAYKPLEIAKGLGTQGAMFNFPVINLTGDIIIRPEKFPVGFGLKSRDWAIKQLPKNFATIARLEAEIPAKYKQSLSSEDTRRYQQMLRDGRIELTKLGIYDPLMMSVLKRARCTVERTNFECSLSGE
ncbi:putative solute-binding protein [Acinetobacter beijerinckii]|uniref:putative solute-binding protein n=1 Tax=Acinetobacter beijerinckii TaxID=262668 RepID=UPI003AF93909